MLGSNHDGERANAAAQATKLLASLNMTWNDLVQRAFAAQPKAEPPPKGRGQNQWSPPPWWDQFSDLEEAFRRHQAEEAVRRAKAEKAEEAARKQRASSYQTHINRLELYQMLLGWDGLTEWERTFVKGLADRGWTDLSEKQYACLERIVHRYDYWKEKRAAHG